MHLPPELLIAATGCRAVIAARVQPHLEAAMQKRGVLDTPQRAANFLAQCAHESLLFERTEESFAYSPSRLCAVWPTRFYLPPDPAKGRRDASELANKPNLIAEAVYGGRKDLGNVSSGDGYRFRGRGFIQLTGRSNYQLFNQAEPTYPALTFPDVVASTEGAAASAVWYWWSRGLNLAADRDADVESVTKRINGGLIGIKERVALTLRARGAFGIG